jgi:ABC-type nitrate/sulfonate/bicarbonate transport system substrate-binding protein
MSCCDETTARVPGIEVSRRAMFKGAALVASVLPAARPTRSQAQGKPVKLAYCSQLLCGVPYEVARSTGLFRQHGLEVELVYTRGGNAAMQALVGGAVDYAATALDVAIQAYVNVGADVRRFAVTGRLPLFALVTAPKTADQIRAIKDLEGKTVAVSALGNADHALTLYLLKQAGADAADRRLVERILTLGGARWSLVRHVYLPSVAAGMLGSLKVAVGFAFTGAVVGEFVAASRGLGYLMSFAQSTFNCALMFAVIFLILVVVLAIFAAAGRLEKRLLRWS